MPSPRSTLPAIVAGFVVAFVSPTLAEQPKAEGPKAPRIDRLIDQLGSESFAEREAAARALQEVGEPALAALQKAAKGSPDAEVRRRSRVLAARLTDSYRLHGTWVVISAEENGEPADERKGHQITFSGDHFTVSGGTASGAGLFQLDETTSPKRITCFWGFNDGSRCPCTLGVYRVKDDTLTICWMGARKPVWPREFKTLRGTWQRLEVYRRKQPRQGAQPR